MCTFHSVALSRKQIFSIRLILKSIENNKTRTDKTIFQGDKVEEFTHLISTFTVIIK
jgi:hypothetical protein